MGSIYTGKNRATKNELIALPAHQVYVSYISIATEALLTVRASYPGLLQKFSQGGIVGFPVRGSCPEIPDN